MHGQISVIKKFLCVVLFIINLFFESYQNLFYSYENAHLHTIEFKKMTNFQE